MTIEAIRILGAGMIGAGVLALYLMFRRSLELDTCAGCGGTLPFDDALGDYPAACSHCLEELYETAQREMGQW
jgi:predicted amidophosphoribosyltransferase